MQKCSSCQAADATVQILDLEEGAVVSSSFLCNACASTGAGAAKQPSVNLPSEILESLLGTFTTDTEEQADAKVLACPGCKLTLAQFRLRGRLGCPRCYSVFRTALIPLLERVHDATCHRGRFPGRVAPSPPPRVPDLGELRNRLQTAIEEERYEDAAKLRDELDQAKQQLERGSD